MSRQNVFLSTFVSLRDESFVWDTKKTIFEWLGRIVVHDLRNDVMNECSKAAIKMGGVFLLNLYVGHGWVLILMLYPLFY
jgi:hypothetical protein